MAGYDWYKGMSNNAVEAYDNGERPLSKWTKRELLALSIEALANEDYYTFDFDKAVELLKSLKLVDLKKTLEPTGWHHTSKFYNCTDFYKINSEYILDYLNQYLNFNYDWDNN